MLEVSVCIGSSCYVKGSYNVIQAFQQLIEEHDLHDKINLKAAFCMKECQINGVSVNVNGEAYNVSPEKARAFFKDKIIPQA